MSTGDSAPRTPASELKRANILLVDDEPRNLLSLEAVLQLLGQNLVKAGSGKEALKCVLDQDFAVILLDVQMAEMDGFETARLIRQREKSRQVPIIFITAVNQDEMDVFKGYSAGAVDFLFKPVHPEIVRSKVKVFVELYFKTEQIRLQQEALEREREKAADLELKEREIRELQTLLAQQRTLSGWGETSVTATMAGIGPLGERAPEVVAALQTEYESLIEEYLEALGFNETPPRAKITDLANRIGAQGGGPRDVVDLHLHVVKTKSDGALPRRARAYAVEGRLLALEVMGNLVDYYRLGRAISRRKETTQGG